VEHTATQTLTRELEVQPGVDALHESLEISQPLDVRPIDSGEGRSDAHRVIREGRVIFFLALVLYVMIAVLLDFKYHAFTGDAFSRMANGFYILYSRDQHLAAVGFVWTPLQSLADLVFLLGNHLWPALSHNNMAGSLVSALAMAGAVYQIRSALLEWGLSRMPRLVLTACFALNPMILFYAGNGMSEGLFLFTLVVSARYLLRWMHRGDLPSLAYAGVALGFCYLTRNEAAGAAVLGTVAVGAVSYWRAAGRRPSRARTAISDLVIFGVPAFVAAAGWAITSYVITGHFFEQFTSIYGNSAQELFLHHKTFDGRVLFEVHAIGALGSPLLPVVLVASLIVAAQRRDPRMLAPVAVLGGALGFDMLAYLNNSIEDFFRYFIVAVPLEVLLLGSLVAAVQNPRPSRVDVPVRTRSSHSGVRVLAAVAGVALVLVVMIPAAVTTGSAMFNPTIGSEETQEIGFIFHSHLTADDHKQKDHYAQILALGSYFADLHLPNGDIVTDNSTKCVPEIITTISQPRVFVIPNDRDFERVLADPITFHAHYILEPDPSQTPLTAPNIEYPFLWNTGSNFTKMVHQFPARGLCPEFRLFHVLGHSNQVA
jgi:hypothetical protein